MSGEGPRRADGGESGSAGRTAVSLTARTVRGFAWALTGTVSQSVLQIVSMVLLARLLTPEEFGAAAAAALVIGISQLVSQLGVGPALVQRRTLSDQEVSAAFHFSILLSLLLAGGVYLLTPAFNGLVGLPADSTLLRLMSVALVLSGIAAVPLGLLQRRLRFRAMAVVDVLAFGPATIGVSVVLAALGHGAVSIVWGQIAAALVTAVGYLAMARPAMRPAGPVTAWRSIAPLIGFGSGYSLSQVGNWLALNSDNFIVANMLGTGALGVYNRAYALLSQPANVIGSAVDKALFPAMSRVRDDGPRLRNAYVRAASLVALVTVPGSVLLFVLAPEIVQILLGDGWTAVVVPLQVFALVLLPRASYKISGSLTRATGAVYRGAWRQWLYAAEVLTGCVIGARWGIDGVAIGASAAIVLHFLVMLRFSARVAPGLAGTVLTMYVKHLPTAVAVALVCLATSGLVRPLGSDLLTVALTGLAGLLVAVAVVVVLRRYFVEEIAVFAKLARPGHPSPSREPSVPVS